MLKQYLRNSNQNKSSSLDKHSFKVNENLQQDYSYFNKKYVENLCMCSSYQSIPTWHFSSQVVHFRTERTVSWFLSRWTLTTHCAQKIIQNEKKIDFGRWHSLTQPMMSHSRLGLTRFDLNHKLFHNLQLYGIILQCDWGRLPVLKM